MVNSVTLVGRLGRDPEARTTTGGTVVANFSVATDSRKKDGSAWVKATTWHRCTCFGKTAENLVEFVKKGHLVYVRGSYQSRTYEKDGATVTTMEVLVDEVKFLEPKASGGDPGAPPPSGRRSGESGMPPAGGAPEDDIPF